MATTTALATEVAPQEVGLDPGRLARLDAYLDGFVANGRHKGSLLAITRGGRIAHVSHRGQRDAEAGLPVEPDTIWRIYSMTKPITSVAAMLLYEEGALRSSTRWPSSSRPSATCASTATGSAAAPVTARAARADARLAPAHAHVGAHLRLPAGQPRRRGLSRGRLQSSTRPPSTTSPRPATSGPGCRCCSSRAPSGTTRCPPTCWEGRRGRLRPVAGRVLRRAHLRAAGHDRHGLLGLRGRPPRHDARSTPTTRRPPPRSRIPGSTRSRPSRPSCSPAAHGLASTAADYHRFTQMLLRRGELDGVRLLAPRTVDFMTANHLPGNATSPTSGARCSTSPATRATASGSAWRRSSTRSRPRRCRWAGEYRWEGAAGTAFWVDPAADMTVLFFTQVLFGSDDAWLGMRPLVYQALVDG